MIFHDQLIDAVPLAVLDTETTGLEPALGHRVIELAILRLEGWQETGQMDELVNPGRPISPSASRVNQIVDADVTNAPRFPDLVGRVADLLEGTLVVAHNAAFDAAFIAAEWTLTSLPPLTNPCACTLLLARNWYRLPRNGLGQVARELGIRRRLAHRAMPDVWVTAQIFRRMLKDLNQWGVHTVGELMHAQGGIISFPAPAQVALPSPLDRAVQQHTPIGIRYLDDHGNVTERVIEPYFLRSYQGDGYLTAFCRLRNAQRTFRIDRILAAFPAYP